MHTTATISKGTSEQRTFTGEEICDRDGVYVPKERPADRVIIQDGIRIYVHNCGLCEALDDLWGDSTFTLAPDSEVVTLTFTNGGK